MSVNAVTRPAPSPAPAGADVTVVVATRLEAWAVRRRAPGAAVERGGVGLAGWRPAHPMRVAASVGVAGGLAPGVEAGTAIIATEIALEGGDRVHIDPAWVHVLERAANRLGIPSMCAPLVTARRIVSGAERRPLAAQGFVAADMETALLIGLAPVVVAVRVVLDSVSRDLSSSWERPARAAVDPRRWPEALWLAARAPACALRAAAVVGAALHDLQVTATKTA